MPVRIDTSGLQVISSIISSSPSHFLCCRVSVFYLLFLYIFSHTFYPFYSFASRLLASVFVPSLFLPCRMETHLHYDMDHGEGSTACSTNPKIDRRDAPSFYIAPYIEQNRFSLHGRQIPATHLASNVREIGDLSCGLKRDIAMGTWINRCRYWGGRFAPDSIVSFQ